MADFFDRSIGIGYTGGTPILFICVLASLALWHFTLGSVNVGTVASPKVEIFYWVTITFSQTLGTALGDGMADDTGLWLCWRSAGLRRRVGDSGCPLLSD